MRDVGVENAGCYVGEFGLFYIFAWRMSNFEGTGFSDFKFSNSLSDN